VREAEVAGHLAREPAVQVAKALLRAPVREGLEIDLSVDQRREDPTAVEAAAQRQDEAAAAQLEAAVDGLLERLLDLAHGAMVDRARPERQPSEVDDATTSVPRPAKGLARRHARDAGREASIADDPRRLSEGAPRDEIRPLGVEGEKPRIGGEQHQILEHPVVQGAHPEDVGDQRQGLSLASDVRRREDPVVLLQGSRAPVRQDLGVRGIGVKPRKHVAPKRHALRTIPGSVHQPRPGRMQGRRGADQKPVESPALRVRRGRHSRHGDAEAPGGMPRAEEEVVGTVRRVGTRPLELDPDARRVRTKRVQRGTRVGRADPSRSSEPTRVTASVGSAYVTDEIDAGSSPGK